MSKQPFSLKVLFDRVVTAMIPGAPFRIVSEEFAKGDDREVLKLTKSRYGDRYHAQVYQTRMTSSYLNGGLKKFIGVGQRPYGGGGFVAKEEIPALVSAWQQEKSAQGWTKTGIVLLGEGADHRALPARQPV